MSECIASTSSAPLKVSVVLLPPWSAPASAVVSMSTTAMAIAAPTCVPPPEAPFSATVIAVFWLSALIVNCPAEPVTDWLSAMPAVVSSSTTLRPNDAPTPTLLPPAPCADEVGEASTKLSVRLCASRSTSPPTSVTLAAPEPP